MGQTEVAETIHNIEQFGIKVYEGGGEVWFDDYGHKQTRSDADKIKIGLYSRKIQENKLDFLEFIWRRDRENSYNKNQGKTFVDRMVGKRGII